MTARSDTVAELAPIATHERIALFDVLRGFCLFGVLWSNLNDWYTVAAPVTSIDHAIQWTQIWLVEGRFYSMLGFLFGIGFAIQLMRAAERGQDGRNVFLRRMAVLLAFGIVHAFLIWHGDVLIAYAIAGFALVFFRRWSPRHLLIAVPVLSLLLTYAVVHLAAIFNVHLPRWGESAEQQLDGHALQVYAHGTWAQSIAVGAQQYAGWFVRYLLLEGINSFLALFLLGLWAVRVDLITRLTSRKVYIIGALLSAAVCWAGFRYGQLHLDQWWSAPQVTLGLGWRKLRLCRRPIRCAIRSPRAISRLLKGMVRTGRRRRRSSNTCANAFRLINSCDGSSFSNCRRRYRGRSAGSNCECVKARWPSAANGRGPNLGSRIFRKNDRNSR